jgi:protein-disulfide isomerase
VNSGGQGSPFHPGFKPARLCAAVLLALAASLCAAVEPVPVGADPAMTREQADAVLQELREIRRVLERMEQAASAGAGQKTRAPRTASLELEADRPVLGSEDAPVTVVEFTDYQCPFCRRFVESTFPDLKREFIDTGKVRWLVQDLPLAFHPNARGAGQAAHCAGEQGSFWPMRDMLFRNSARLDPASIRGYARVLDLDMGAFDACIEAERYTEAMDRDSASAQKLRITGTPTFVIGRSDGERLSGRVIVGAQAIAVFRGEIRRLLEDAGGKDTVRQQ